ncbi:MAG: PD40 domain-containing protein, partial [Bacteroidia bacterium]|nr:PD40 domain-containing protein [Bacteroidia bacterium]
MSIIRGLAGKILVLYLLLQVEAAFGQNASSFDDIKKEADKFFKEEDYVRAYKLYSQLVSNFPKDPEYNFRLGVCMIYAEPDKKKCLPYLKAATGAGKEAPKESEFYLAKGFHINYQFDEAIKHYNTYKLSASASQVKKLQVDREIKSAANGKHLLSNLTDLEVISKTQLSESDYFRNYKKIGGKLLVKPDEFKTSTDKKKKEKSVVFLPNTGELVYFSSYGEDDDNGRDIYVAYKKADGTFGKPEKVKGINTEFDEDYPFLHPDGKTLYFASKGYNSMGGYDIFKSVYNEGTGSWEAPVNMEFPINSPDDDYLFVTDSLETIAYFSTGRQSVPGKIDVLKVKTKRRPIDILAVTGKVIPGSPEYPLACSITIKDLFSDATIGNYNSEENGDYSIEVPNGGKLVFTVETPGLETQSAQVNLPFTKTSKPFRQTISYESGKLKVLNYFDEPTNDDDYLKYLKVIEKKARLDVNEGENKIPDSGPPETVATNTNSSGKSTNTPNTPANQPKQTLSNTELSKIAKQDAGESKKEASELNRGSLAAKDAGNKQKQAADKKLAEANDALNKANEIVDLDEKKVALETANEQLKIAEREKNSAEKLLVFATALDDDAKHKQKEAELNDQYAKELEKAVKNKNSKESLAKLEDLQKQITEATSYKSASEEITNGIKNEIE